MRRTSNSSRASRLTLYRNNHSSSHRMVLRGLHYQLPPNVQGKLVRVVKGAAYDVAVDIRRSSPTFGNWTGVELSRENRFQLWIPPGFAHGFLATTDSSEVLYKTTSYHSPNTERSIRWNDPQIGVEWPLDGEPTLSGRDRDAPLLADADVFD